MKAKAVPVVWTRRDWLGALPAGVVAAAGLGASAMPAAAATPATTATTAPIVWPELNWADGSHTTAASFQGVPVVLVFWATWCGYCRRHNAHIDALYRSVEPSRLRVISAAIDSDAPGVRRYLTANGYRFPVALDTGGLRPRFTPRRVVPMTCTLDRDGRLQQCIPGEMAEADVMDLARLAR